MLGKQEPRSRERPGFFVFLFVREGWVRGESQGNFNGKIKIFHHGEHGVSRRGWRGMEERCAERGKGDG